eukprot:CAMPEP_0203669208 /NCGR_PEP_ID=MMETSP0090-20130426/5637_1 /ASSEMBLY_ACC=CAM_ASM_001088 /TAXON_ID=426623 /ORGANISM="Chaetoceros affinis, Strain CCMP159" /LENGTH=310 /DNA_ID=CAMNT_0050533829 /DNA_START=60 /DNA_END=992 /DNA_ORIENTATION=+
MILSNRYYMAMLLLFAGASKRNTSSAFVVQQQQQQQHHNHHHQQQQLQHQRIPIRVAQSLLFSQNEGGEGTAVPTPTPAPAAAPAAATGVPAIEPLKPFLPAMDPNYMNIGPVGQEDGNESTFILKRSSPPTKDELSNENLYKILMIECSDLEVNTLVWKCLGYAFDTDAKEWNSDNVFPKWREKYPTPPDLIGMQRIYTKEVDRVSLKANQSLVRSVPVDNKQSLKTHLRPLGFTGYKYAELTPNKTRRAQCANWLLYYREELFGFTVEELKERRQKKKEAEEAEKLRLEKESGKKMDDEWKPPVTEVF